METNVNYTIVGAFVIVLFTAIVLGIIWLSSGFSLERYTTYAVYSTESVSGITIDSPVEYNGVDVGNVKAIEIDPKNPQQVILLLNIKASTPITRGTVAMITTRGVTGMAFVALKDNSEDLRLLVARRGEPYPVIPTAPSFFVRLDTALTMLSKNFDKIGQSISTLLDPENQESIKKTLNSLERITQAIAANNERMTQLISNTARASNQFSPLLQSSTNTVRMLETQTLPAMYRVLNNLDNVTRTLSEVSVEIKQNPSILIRGVERQTLGPGESR